MINGLGVVGWGVGGIEAEAGMLGQPVYFLTPEVVGVHITGAIARRRDRNRSGAAHHADAAKGQKVVGKFVEFYGAGAASLPVADRATIANMAPEYGATMGFFPVDAESVNYLRATGRTDEQCRSVTRIISARRRSSACRRKAKSITASISNSTWPKCSRAWPDRNARKIGSISPILGMTFVPCFGKPVTDGGYGKSRR